MYAPLRSLVQHVFQVSSEAPHVPPGGHGRAHVFRAARAFWNYRMLGYAIRTGLLAVFFLGGAAGAAFGLGAAHWPTLGIALGGVLVLVFLVQAIVSYVLVRLDYEFRWYVVTDRSLRIRQGILSFEETTLTFANVQNVSIRQGPLERWFGFANVLVETAGGGGSVAAKEQAIAQGGHRGLIRGLENAEEVKQLIRDAVVRQGGAGLGDHDDRAPEPAVEAVVTLSEAAPALRAVLDEVKALRASLDRSVGASLDRSVGASLARSVGASLDAPARHEPNPLAARDLLLPSPTSTPPTSTPSPGVEPPPLG